MSVDMVNNILITGAKDKTIKQYIFENGLF